MEDKKEDTGKTNANPNNGVNMPEWLMHLLTGLGTMGAEFMLFIKPLQDKIEGQNKQIREQERRIDELEDKIDRLGRKPKRRTEDIEDLEEEADLFQIKKPAFSNQRQQKQSHVRL